jgi:hypothetical protein
MYHTIEFAEEFTVDLEISPKHRLERMLIRRGTRLQTQIKPYVTETEDGPVEVADLFLADARSPAWCLSSRSHSWTKVPFSASLKGMA